MEEKVLIFGTGGVGKKVKALLEREGKKVIGFIDNDNSKWNQEFEQCRIYGPEYLMELEYDLIAIGVYKAVEKIKTQLLELGVSEKKIVIPIEPVRIFPLVAEKENIQKIREEEYYSLNTINYVNQKIVIEDEEFLKKLEDLKKVLDENNIPVNKVCVVSGAVLQAYALRQSKKFDDIDIIMTSDLRKIYGSGLVIVSSTAEMHPQNEYDISDDELIEDMKHHFIFRGLKFANLNIVQRNIQFTSGKK